MREYVANTAQRLAVASGVVGVLSTVVMAIDKTSGFTGAGVGVGLFLASLYVWLED